MIFSWGSGVPWTRRIALLGCGLLACAGISLMLSTRSEAAAPVLTVSPGGPFQSGQTIAISVGANSVFTPHSAVNVLECADPGGTVANLPKDDSSCDGNTIQANTIIVADNGSFSETGYTLYQLPSAALGEQANFQPVCNESNPCVLYIGQDQNDFTAPKLFSALFTIGPGSGSTSPSSPSSPSSVAGSSSSSGAKSAGSTSSDSAVRGSVISDSAVDSVSLAQTGFPNEIPWLAAIGTAMLMTGALGRRLTSRRAA
jgi:hypothetical protein